MRKTTVLITLLLTALSMVPGAGSPAGETQKKEDNKGTTVDDLGRGLKSAAKNVEEEIPKIGPAIGNAFKKATAKSKESDQKSSQKGK